MKNVNLLRQAIVASIMAPSMFNAVPTLADDKLVLEEVVVQARRIEESQQDSPVAVSVITENMLLQNTVTAMEDIQRLVPALQISDNNLGKTDFVIRGSFANQFADPGVITYVDEVPVDARVVAYGMYDMASIEQLKGPQGTLFGKNSTGGAVLMFSKRPSSELDGYIRARVGQEGEHRLEGATNIPVSDTFSMRVAGQWQEKDPRHESIYNGNEYGQLDNYSVRLSALWTPTENIENYTQITHYRVDQNFPASIAVEADLTSSFGALAVNAVNIQNSLPSDKTVNDYPYDDIYDYDAINNTTTIDLSDRLSIKNIVSYSEIKQEFGRDYDGTNVDLYSVDVDGKYETFYDELQLIGTALDERMSWRLGASYSSTDSSEILTANPFTVVTNLSYNNAPDIEATTQAVFGQATYDFDNLVNGLSLTLGYRHTWDDREYELQSKAITDGITIVNQYVSGPLAGTSYPGFAPVPVGTCLTVGLSANDPTCKVSGGEKFDDSNYNITLNWNVTDSAMVYLAHRKGYKSGGFNTASPDPERRIYEPETIKDVEIGLKADWDIGVPVRTNVALYQAEYEGIQLGETVNNVTVVNSGFDAGAGSAYINGALVPTSLIVNTDSNGDTTEATFTGYEVEVTIKPTTWLDISAFYAVVDTEWDKNVTTDGDYKGKPVGKVVPKTSGLTARVYLPTFENWGDAVLTTTYYGADASETWGTDIFTGRQDRIDVRLTAQNIAGSGFDMAFYGRNITDDETCTLTTLPFGTFTEVCNEGSQYGVELTYNFGE